MRKKVTKEYLNKGKYYKHIHTGALGDRASWIKKFEVTPIWEWYGFNTEEDLKYYIVEKMHRFSAWDYNLIEVAMTNNGEWVEVE